MTKWVYEVQVVGPVSESDLARIDAEVGTVLVTTQPVTTVIGGSVADQSGLVGLLDLMHALGLQVWGLRRLNDPDRETDGDVQLRPGPGLGRT